MIDAIRKKIERPLLQYDGDCRFCVIWVKYWQQLTEDKIDYQAVRAIDVVRLYLPTGEVLIGAAAAYKTLGYSWGRGWLWWLYKKLWVFRKLSDIAYRFIADHRRIFYHLTRFLWGAEIRPATHLFTRWFFLRILGAIFLVAFLSLGLQLDGLIGSDGILSASNLLKASLEQMGAKDYWRIPTLAWISSSDLFFHLIAIAGMVFSVLLIFNFIPRVSLIALYVLYLSLFSIGQVFLSYQWDALLLEVGFLAILLSFSTGIVWLFRWLVFRLIFLSGAVKLISGDLSWRNFTALNYHYETQPLPNIFSWYIHQLPEWFDKFSVIVMFSIQLVVPFFIFAPRRLRLFAAGSIVFLESLIFISGNYNFFNILTIALCLFLLDDALIQRLAPKKILEKSTPIFGKSLIAFFALLVFVLSAIQMFGLFNRGLPPSLRFMVNLFLPYHIANNYGLFAVMTTARPEIIVEGSNDLRDWKEYGFKYKPDDPKESPRWAAPHQPRLDWQMWFAALNDFQQNPWFTNLMIKLAQGSKPVLKLFAENPFPDAPPKYLRASLYEYKFTDFAEKSETGAWWKRELRGLYFPVVSLENQQ